MNIAYFKIRCFVCFKSFEIPKLPDSAYGEYLFCSDGMEFRHFNWFENKDLKNTVEYILSNNFELQVENDNTKGRKAIEIVAKLADGDFNSEFRFSKCPRCKNRFHSYPNKKN